MLLLLLHAGSTLWAMEQPKKSKIEQEKIAACIANLPADPVPASVVKRATFSKDNTFEMGEIVIVDSHINNEYLYGCVTKTSSIVGSTLSISGEKFSVGVWRKKWKTEGHHFGSSVGKISSPKPLIDLSAEAIAQQIKSNKLNLKDIKSVLPQELYEKVIKALHKL